MTLKIECRRRLRSQCHNEQEPAYRTTWVWIVSEELAVRIRYARLPDVRALAPVERR